MKMTQDYLYRQICRAANQKKMSLKKFSAITTIDRRVLDTLKTGDTLTHYGLQCLCKAFPGEYKKWWLINYKLGSHKEFGGEYFRQSSDTL